MWRLTVLQGMKSHLPALGDCLSYFSQFRSFEDGEWFFLKQKKEDLIMLSRRIANTCLELLIREGPAMLKLLYILKMVGN